MEVFAKPEEVGLSSKRLARIKPWLQSYQKIRPNIIDDGNSVIRSRASGYQPAGKPLISLISAKTRR